MGVADPEHKLDGSIRHDIEHAAHQGDLAATPRDDAVQGVHGDEDHQQDDGSQSGERGRGIEQQHNQ